MKNLTYEELDTAFSLLLALVSDEIALHFKISRHEAEDMILPVAAAALSLAKKEAAQGSSVYR